MKRFLSIVMLMAVANMQAAPLVKIEQAIEDTDLATFKQLLQENTLTEAEAQFLLSRADFAAHLNEKIYFTDIKLQGSNFLMGVGFAYLIACHLASNEKLFLGFMGVFVSSLALYDRYTWKKTTEPKLYTNLYAECVIVSSVAYISR